MRRSSPPCAAAIPTRPRAPCTRTSIRSPICCRPTTAMDPADIDAYLVRLDEAIGRGRRLRELRPVLEDAYVESRDALDRRDYELSLATTCGILEAIITDALAHARNGDATHIAALSFAERIAAAERAGLIRGACSRLPDVARTYRDGGDRLVVERDARVAGQVLHVVMRDLNPGR